jgi:hypothetical protein
MGKGHLCRDHQLLLLLLLLLLLCLLLRCLLLLLLLCAVHVPRRAPGAGSFLYLLQVLLCLIVQLST